MAKKQPAKMATGDLNALIQDNFSTLQDELGGELREWYDNLPENFQDNRSDIDEAASALENLNNIDDAPEVIRDIPVTYNANVNGRSTSRASRGSQATYEMGAACDAAQDWLDDDANHAHKDREEVEQWITEVREVIEEAEGVEYPGMYA